MRWPTRLDNLGRLHLDPVRDKAARYLQETLEHYLPLAGRAHPSAEGRFRDAVDAAARLCGLSGC